MNKILSIKLISGDEIFGEEVEISEKAVVVKNAMRVMPTPDGRLGFVPYCAFTNNPPERLNLSNSHIITSYEATLKNFVDLYKDTVKRMEEKNRKDRTGIILPSDNKFNI